MTKPRSTLVLLALFLMGTTSAMATPGAQTRSKSWWDRSRALSTQHYRIRSDLSRVDAREMASYLEAAHKLFSDHFGELRARSRSSSTALVFRTRDDYQRTLLARYGIDARGTGGMFFEADDTTVLALWTESTSTARLRHVIQHEGFHQFAFAYFGNDLPMWVNEGLAEYFGASIPIGGKLIPGQAIGNGDAHVAQAVEDGIAIPFSRMLRMRKSGWDDAVRGDNPALLYEQAASMVRFLIQGENKRYAPAFERYLALLNQAVPADSAFARAFGADGTDVLDPALVDQFETRWRRFAASPATPPAGAAYARLDFLAAGLLELQIKDVHPATLDELRSLLRAHEFSRTLDRHGHPIEQTPDDSMFTLDLGVLTLSPALHPTSAREKQLNETNRRPAVLRTSDLHPRDLEVAWIRTEDNSTFRYVIRTTNDN